MEKILACIDGSTYFNSVCGYAAWASKRTAAPVELLHVLGRAEVSSVPADFSGNLGADEQSALLSELAELDADRMKLHQRRGRMLLDQAKARMQAEGVAVEARLRNGDLVETVAEFERDARLVVIGKRGEASKYATAHLGSNLERVVRSSHRPVMVASRAYRPIQRFLIAFDGGPSATRAVELAATDALLKGLECHILMAGSKDSRGPLDAAVKRLEAAGLRVNAHSESGHAEDVIARYVEREDIDCVVMGAYGHSRIRNLIIGSTTTAMVLAAKVPIIMVR